MITAQNLVILGFCDTPKTKIFNWPLILDLNISFRYMFLLSAYQNPIIFLKREKKVT